MTRSERLSVLWLLSLITSTGGQKCEMNFSELRSRCHQSCVPLGGSREDSVHFFPSMRRPLLLALLSLSILKTSPGV